jgi:hypothetical protein
MSDDLLRGLIRYIPPVRTLKEDLEKSLHLETYAGTGDLAIRSFNGLQAGIAQVSNDPYVGSLALSPPESATDREKISLAMLAAGQLAAYLEGQTGLPAGSGSGGGHVHYQLAPNINIHDVTGLPAETIDKIVAAGTRKGGDGEGAG